MESFFFWVFFFLVYIALPLPYVSSTFMENQPTDFGMKIADWICIFHAIFQQGNYSVTKSPDEYTIVIDTARGPKEFQYDSIFMPDTTQERVFEDTSVSIILFTAEYFYCSVFTFS